MSAVFRLVPGSAAPVQQSRISCGSACLVVARLLWDPALATWVRTGVGEGATADPGTPEGRFAQLEREVMARTNAVAPYPGLLQVPWPRHLGTPPWGARVELEQQAAAPGTAYEFRWLRRRRSRDLSEASDVLASRVSPGRPALLYVGNSSTPRHVTLVFIDDAEAMVYEPARGQIHPFTEVAARVRRLDLAGWNEPWLVVQPLDQRVERSPRRLLARRQLGPREALSQGTLARR